MNKDSKRVLTSFNMDVNLKAKAKMYIAFKNQQSLNENQKEPLLDLGKLINTAVDVYLEDVKVK